MIRIKTLFRVFRRDLRQRLLAQSKNPVVDHREHDLQVDIWIILEEVAAGLDRLAPGFVLRIAENARGNKREANGPAAVFHGKLQ